jgi:hypothetical protein
MNSRENQIKWKATQCSSDEIMLILVNRATASLGLESPHAVREGWGLRTVDYFASLVSLITTD